MSDEKKRILDYRSKPIHTPDVFAGLERVETGIIKEPPSQVIPRLPYTEEKESSCASYLVLIYIVIFILILVLNISKKNEHHRSTQHPKAWKIKVFCYQSIVLLKIFQQLSSSKDKLDNVLQKRYAISIWLSFQNRTENNIIWE